ncbi:GNAT family N-acetyltransferase [Paenibacillus sp. L3-i20]|uniref:GNAT family N-acetyltransferase n=1 Tax=Paenibacillus sp. L3-i20 TaxID=2905833 RepID=UPI001EDD0869|nr:GNAT family N-acetyltransferase [Paenibacillus sp. L3-i20]GKU79165.1 hypothetical protein L3i20_v235620 [Paenibacillus sp. L3-i20]
MIRLCQSSEAAIISDIINDAATAYKGVIPEDRYHEPYMSLNEVESEINDGVVFWGYLDEKEQLIGIMGLQDKGDVSLIRHAYVKTSHRSKGIGGTLIEHLLQQTTKPILIGTWAAASWAIRFYNRYGFRLVSKEEKEHLLRIYWNVPTRQIEESVVLSNAEEDKRLILNSINALPVVEKATIADAGEILALQKLAYISEAEIYNDYTIEPLVQTLEDLQKQFEDHIFLKAVIDGTIIGSVRAKLTERSCIIGKLIVHPSYQGRGIGKQLMTDIEASFKNCLKYELFTGSKSNKNLQLYERLGYITTGEKPIHEHLSIVYLEKINC